MTSLEMKNLTRDRQLAASEPSACQDANSSPGKLDRESLVSWLFLIGSLIFTLDAILEILKGISFSATLHISSSVLFTIGSVLFIPSNQQK
jgi:hypothetical protein